MRAQGPAGAGHGRPGHDDRIRAPALPAGVRLRCGRPPFHHLPQGAGGLDDTWHDSRSDSVKNEPSVSCVPVIIDCFVTSRITLKGQRDVTLLNAHETGTSECRAPLQSEQLLSSRVRPASRCLVVRHVLHASKRELAAWPFVDRLLDAGTTLSCWAFRQRSEAKL